MALKTKCVYSKIDKEEDGLRILCTRFRGRGLRKNRYNVWMANLGPSEKLLKKYQNDKISWNEFKLSYKRELLEGYVKDKINNTIRNKGQKFTLRLLRKLSLMQDVTLLCHCDENQKDCHRNVLRDIIIKI